MFLYVHHLKNLSISSKIKQKLKFDKESIKLIRNDAKYFFKKFNYSKNVPGIFNI